jgi:uncharacterized surface protein with fasciclin (FAS1) repeats
MMAIPRSNLLLVLGLALAAATSAQDLDLAKPTAEADVTDNIPAVLTAYPGNIFSTLLAAVTAADLAGALDSAGPFTVFAPTDEAFTKYLAAAKLTPAEALASPALREITEHHVVAG